MTGGLPGETHLSILDIENVSLVIKLKIKIHVFCASAIYFKGQQDVETRYPFSFYSYPHWAASLLLEDPFPQAQPVTFL